PRLPCPRRASTSTTAAPRPGWCACASSRHLKRRERHEPFRKQARRSPRHRAPDTRGIDMTSSLLQRQSFIELDARARALALLDAHSACELLDPFDRIRSPWLPRQGIVAQADDGVVVFKGRIDGRPAVVLAIDGAYQGGSMGEEIGR